MPPLTRDSAGLAAPAAETAPDVARPRAEPANGRRVFRLVLAASYPVVILAAWRWLDTRYIGCLLLALLWLQRCAGAGTIAGSLRRLSALEWTVAGLLSCTSAAIALSGSELLLRLYPVLVNIGLLSAFGATLFRGPSMVEKFARLAGHACDERVIRYTRRVTMLWCAFFGLNGAFSLYTALRWDAHAWSLYNGALAYGLAGSLMLAEFAWRTLMLRRDARPPETR